MILHHWPFLLEVAEGMKRREIRSLIKRWLPGPVDDQAPLRASLKTPDGVREALIAEFDADGAVSFVELNAKAKSHEQASNGLWQLEAQLTRLDLVARVARRPPIRRTAVPMQELLAWNRWEIGEARSLQAIAGAFRPSGIASEHVSLAVSLHIGADAPGYGPRMWDVSTGQAIGWGELDRLAPPNLGGTSVLIESATSTIEMVEPERFGPGSAFRIFRD